MHRELNFRVGNTLAIFVLRKLKVSLSQMRLVALVFFLVAEIVCSPSISFGGEGPYCGIYAVYAGAIDLGVDNLPDIQAILKSEYIPSLEGSSDKNLIDAAGVLGVSVVRFDNLSLSSLGLIEGPWIIHVSSDGQLRLKNHWLLVYSVRGRHAEIFDVEQGRVDVPIADILARWDGIGLLLRSKRERRFVDIFPRAIETGFTLATLIIFTAIVRASARLLEKRLPQWLVHTVSFKVLFVATIIFAFSTSRVSMNSINRINSEFASTHIEHVDESFVFEKLTNDPSQIVLVDARYALGDELKLEHTVNLPVDATDFALSQFINKYNGEKLLVLFCQTKDCEFSEIQAKRLYRHGVRNLAIFKGGAEELELLIGKAIPQIERAESR